jgi:glycosyltransferase involved in cell wall biosynthesis
MNHRICFSGAEITPSEGSAFVGGHVNTVVGLCKGLTELGWEVHIVTTPSRFLKKWIPDFPWAKIHVIRANGRYNSLAYDLDFLKKSVQTIKNLHLKHSFDIIHGHSGYFSLSIIPIIVGQKIGIPSLFSLYCPASMFPTKLPIDRYVIKTMSFGIDKIIAVTENVKNSLTEFGVDPKKVNVLPSCFDGKTFNISSLKPNTQKTDSKTQTILFVGNVNKTKGLDIFLSAAKSVLNVNPSIRFVVTLHEPAKVVEQAREKAFRLLGSSVEVLGVVENMAQLVASVDVIAAPFRSTEGISDIPIIILEAMALGKPVVASDLGGIKEAVVDGKTGIIVKLNNSEALAFSLNKLLSDPLLKEKMGKEAISQVQKFSYLSISQKLSDFYTKILESS